MKEKGYRSRGLLIMSPPPRLGKLVGTSQTVVVCISDFAFTEVEKIISNCQIFFARGIKINNAIV